jgi:transposase-like protein
MDEAEDDVLAHMGFPKEHWAQLHSTNPLERLNGEMERRESHLVTHPIRFNCSWCTAYSAAARGP